MPSTKIIRSRLLPSCLINHRLILVISYTRSSHHSGSNCRWVPIRVCRLKQSRCTTNMRTSHRESNPVGPTASVQAAKMLTPGAIKSGLRISGFNPLGPLPVNEATTGAGLIPMTVPLKSMVAVGFADDETYDLTASPSSDPRAQAGKI
ncbi:hypothetical protein QQP08_008730 [Theobroma cacao]|nr:hypothetical protein QQP08_008730 [Theobroma cacao]